MSFNLNSTLSTTIEQYKKTYPDFSEALSKWRVLICSTVQTLSKSLSIPVSDSFQDVILKLHEANIFWHENLYKHEKKSYAIVDMGDSESTIRTSRIRKKFKQKVVKTSELEEIKKCSLNSFIYRRIIQSAADMQNRYFIEKNGFKVKKVDKVVKSRSGNVTEYKSLECKNIKNKYPHVSYESFIREVDNVFKNYSEMSPEDILILKETIESRSQ